MGENIIELHFLRFHVQIVTNELDECNGNVSTWDLKDDNGGRGWAYRKRLKKVPTDIDHWLETAHSIPLSTNTYVKVNLTQKVIKNEKAEEKNIGAVVVMKKDCTLLAFEVSNIEILQRKDIIKGGVFPKHSYVKEVVGSKLPLNNEFCINGVKENITEINIFRADPKAKKKNPGSGVELSPVEKERKKIADKLKELAVQKAAEEEHPGSVTAQIITEANEKENSVTLIDASKIYDDDKCKV